MRIHYLFVLILVIFSSCSKEDPSDPSDPSNPAPSENQKVVNVTIEDEYNFNGYKIYSTTDSLEIGNSEFEMTINKDEPSYLIIEGNGEILAVLDVNPNKESIILNSTNVAASILDILPSFQTLSEENQNLVIEDLKSNAVYQKYVEKIDALLKGNSPIYSNDQEFLDLLLSINSFITGELTTVNPSSTARSYHKAPIPDEEIGDWINIENKTLDNQRHSFISVDINSEDGSAGLHELMQPDPFLSGSSSFSLDFSEDCYILDLSQSTDEAFEKNYDHAANIFIGIVIGKILKAQGSGKQKCISEIHTQLSKSTASSLKSIIFNTSSLDDFAFEAAIGATYDAFLTAFAQEECYTSFINYKVITRMAAARMNVVANLIDMGYVVSDAVQLTGFLEGILDPIEDSEKFQLLQDRMIPGCVDITSNSSLNEKYAAGQEIEVSVKITGADFFEDYELKDFKIQWEIEDGNGELQSTTTSTNQDGVSTNSWFLPDTEGTYMISAVLKDDENDLILSSPIVFTVNATDVNPLIGTWKPLTYNGQPLGTEIIQYFTECPSIPYVGNIMHHQALIFEEDIFTEEMDTEFIDYNIKLNPYVDYCEIYSDDPDEHDRDDSQWTEAYDYDINDNIITVYLYYDGTIDEESQIILNEEKSQFTIVGDDYGDIWVKQEE